MANAAPPDAAAEPQRTRSIDLTVNKVLAGAGASATAAVVGSQLGAAGTVTGAAVGSVASTVATAVYLSSLDRTRDTVRARLGPGRRGEPEPAPAAEDPGGEDTGSGDPGSGDTDPDTDSEGGTGDGGAVPPTPPEPPGRRRRWRAAVVGVLAAFMLGLLAVTGLEWAKGSTLSTGEPGTSIGRVVSPAPVDGTTEPAEDAPTTTDAAPTDEAGSTETGTTTTAGSGDVSGTEAEDAADGDPGAEEKAVEDPTATRTGDDPDPTGGVEPTRAPSDTGGGTTSNG